MALESGYQELEQIVHHIRRLRGDPRRGPGIHGWAIHASQVGPTPPVRIHARPVGHDLGGGHGAFRADGPIVSRTPGPVWRRALFGARRAAGEGGPGPSAPGSLDGPTGPEQTFGSPIAQPKRSPSGSSRSIRLGDVDNGPVMVNHASTPPAAASAAQTVIATWKPLIILAGS